MRSSVADAFRHARAPLFWYYALTVGVPLANACRDGATETALSTSKDLFIAHLSCVISVPPALIILWSIVGKIVKRLRVRCLREPALADKVVGSLAMGKAGMGEGVHHVETHRDGGSGH